MKVAIFPGSFDPFTKGHAAIVSEALTLCDRLVIAVGDNIGKRYLLSADMRLKLIEDLYAHEPRVEVVAYHSLTGEIAREVGATILIRGVRNTIDFEYERTMAQTNRRIFPELQSVLLLTPPELADVSSSTVRELLNFGQSVEQMMPEGVDIKAYLE